MSGYVRALDYDDEWKQRLEEACDEVRAETIEQCAKVAELQEQTFLNPNYASNQPHGSFGERFACRQVAEAIRSLAISSRDRA